MPGSIADVEKDGEFDARTVTGTMCEATPMPQPRIGHTGQKYQAPAVRPTTSHTVNTMTTIAR